jgi:protein-S-isoprenylcysteine O-methyltransferase Ste14
MMLTAFFAVLALVLSFTPYRVMKDEDEKVSGGKGRWGDMAVVVAIMLAWVVSLRYLGFAVTSVLGFTSIAWYISGNGRIGRRSSRALAIGLS